VINSELQELLRDCPTLYHMAESGSWPSIRKDGLLSTAALLDKYNVEGAKRRDIEARRRPKSVELQGKGMSSATIRDQFPMTDGGLERCLKDGLSPSAWYKLLNAKVFFWLTRERLLRLLNAGTYRSDEHDVLEIDARSMVEAYAERIWFCPMNSGCTKPYAHPRGKGTFKRIGNYPYAEWRAKRRRGERVVEVAVDYAVPDVARYVKRVRRMRGQKSLRILFEA
jgi:hypothetical protein